jgi:hypothetical protein
MAAPLFALTPLTEEQALAWFEGLCSYEREFVIAILQASSNYCCELSEMNWSPLSAAIIAVETAKAQLDAAFTDTVDWELGI